MIVFVLYTNRKSIILSPVSVECNLHSHRRFHQFSPRACGSPYEKCYNVELVVNINKRILLPDPGALWFYNIHISKEYHSAGGGNLRASRGS